MPSTTTTGPPPTRTGPPPTGSARQAPRRPPPTARPGARSTANAVEAISQKQREDLLQFIEQIFG